MQSRLRRRLTSICGWCQTRRRKLYVNNRSEEHTSELQSLRHLVCRLLLEKKNKKIPEEIPVDLLMPPDETLRWVMKKKLRQPHGLATEKAETLHKHARHFAHQLAHPSNDA